MIRQNNRLFPVLMVWLLISGVFFNSMMVYADSDITYSANLSDFLTNWNLTIGDTVYDQDMPDDSVIEFKKDVMYNLVMTFEERQNCQLAADGRTLTFPLPQGFRLKDDFSMMLNIHLGKWGTLANNPITYNKDTHSLELRWNTADEAHMKRFRDSTSAVIKLSLGGYLSENETDVFTVNGKTFTLRREDPHNASLTKEGTYDPLEKKIHYTVTVTSDGTTSDLTLTDTLGSALTYSGDIQFISTASVNTAHTAPVITAKTGNTFSVHIPLMNDKDKLVFSYSAAVDPDKIAHSGSASFEETGNTAEIFGDSYTADNMATFYESVIEFSDLVKDSKGVSSEYRNGIPYDNINWQIVTNKDCIYPLSGTTITDTIDESVQSISSYDGDGVEILCYADQQLAEKRFLTWEELGVDPAVDKSWTYHIPETDQVYKYVLNYRTTVNMDHQNQSVVVKNTAKGKGGIDSAYEVLNPVGGNLGVSKTAAEVTSDSVVWEIKLHLRDQAFDREQLVLTEHQNSIIKDGKIVSWQSDHLPYKWLNPNKEASSKLYKETLDTLEITGLYDNETFVLNYGSHDSTLDRHAAGTERRLVAQDSWHSDQWTPEKLSIEFYKDSAGTQGGLNRPTDGTNDRIITVRLKTHFPEEWAQQARQQNINNMDNVTWYYEHLNWADVEGAFDVAKIAPYPIGVYKRVLRDASKSPGYNIVKNGRIYPVYYYQVLVSGVEADTPLVIDDVFDTGIFELYKPHQEKQISELSYYGSGLPDTWDNWYLTSYGGITEFDWLKNNIGICKRIDQDPEHGLTQEETDYGIRFTISKLPKDKNNQYYKFYGIEYWLTAKDEEALRKIEKMTAASLTGEAIFTNKASCRGETAEAVVRLKTKNDFSPIEKISTQFIEYSDGTYGSPEQRIPGKDINRYGLNYRIDLNREKAALNGGADIVAEDAYSANLSVDFTSIRITTDPPGQKVSYDYSGNVGRFTIPDRTHVVIEYQATIISSRQNDIVSVENNVTMLDYRKTRQDEVDYSGSSDSSAANPSILVKKYERGHMETGLSGAVFQLYRYKTGATGNTDADWEPMVYADSYAPTGEGRIPNPNRGSPITFTTGPLTIDGKDYGDGYADIELTDTEHGMNLEYDVTYGLREITTPVRYGENGEIIRFQNPHNDDFFCYKFTLTRNPEQVDYSRYIFRPDETLTVKNDTESAGIRLKKVIDGNCIPTEAEKNHLTYQLYYRQISDGEQKYMPIMTTEKQGGMDVRVMNPHFTNLTYQQITSDDNGFCIDGLRLEEGTSVGDFLLVERGNDTILAAHPDWHWTGTYEWNSGSTGSFSKSAQIVYDASGQHPETVYGAAFQITAEDIRENEQKMVTLVNRYTRETIDLTVVKKWVRPDGAAMSWPIGKKVKLELGRIKNGQFERRTDVPLIELDYQTDDQGEEKQGIAVFRNLPKYEEGTSDTPIQYAVREVTVMDGYQVVYPSGSAAYAEFGTQTAVTIKNQVESLSVTVTKQWRTVSGNAPPSGARAVMRLYAYTGTDPSKAVWVHNVNDIELDGTPDSSGELSAWKGVFDHLPKYDHTGALLTYIVKEQSSFPAGYSALEEYADSGGTITNTPAVTGFSVTKEWQGTENHAWPEDTEITLTLKRKTKSGTVDGDFEAVYRLKSKEIVSQTALSDWSGKPVSVSWDGSVLLLDGLQRFDPNGEEWLYFISEKAMEHYETVYRSDKGYKMEGAVTSGGRVVNIHAVNDLTVQKNVSGRFGSLAKKFDFTVILTNEENNAPYVAAVDYIRTDAEGIQTTGSLIPSADGTLSFQLSHQESICLKKLPADLHYTAEETGSSEGYRTVVRINGGAPEEKRIVSGNMTSETWVLFENSKEGIVPTKVSIPIVWHTALLVGVSSMIGWYFIKRKEK